MLLGEETKYGLKICVKEGLENVLKRKKKQSQFRLSVFVFI